MFFSKLKLPLPPVPLNEIKKLSEDCQVLVSKKRPQFKKIVERFDAEKVGFLILLKYYILPNLSSFSFQRLQSLYDKNL